MLAVHVNAHFCSDGFPDLSANSSVSVPVSPSTPLIVYVAVPKRFNKRRWVRRVGDGDRLSKVCCCPPGCVYNASGGIRPRRERESERERERARERGAREREVHVYIITSQAVCTNTRARAHPSYLKQQDVPPTYEVVR